MLAKAALEVDQNLGQVGRRDADVAVVPAERSAPARTGWPAYQIARSISCIRSKAPAVLRGEQAAVVGPHIGQVLANQRADGDQPTDPARVEGSLAFSSPSW